MSNKNISIIIILFCSVAHSLHGFSQAFSPIASYTAELAGNFSGGEKKTVQWIGLLDAGFTFNTQKAKWWHGGSFDFEAISTHGKGITATALNDIQGISRIEAGNFPFLFWKLSYRQQIKHFSILIGFQNINDFFMELPCINDFSGSSYGVYPTLSRNYSLPNFPTNGLGIGASYHLKRYWTFATALYNGHVSDISKDRFNREWHYDLGRDGLLSVWEIKFNTSTNNPYTGSTGALGFVFHNKMFESVTNPIHEYKNNYTVYGFGMHNFYTNKGRYICGFVQGSYALKDRNPAFAYYAAGLTMTGFVTRTHIDNIGIGLTGVGYRQLFENKPKEMVENSIETFIKLQINKYLSVKPTAIAVVSSAKPFISVAMLEFYLNIFDN